MGGSHRVDYARVSGKRDKEEVAPLVGPRLAQLARAPDCRLETLGCRQPSGGPRFKSGSADQTSLWRCATLKRGRARRMVQAPPSLRELRCHYAPKQKIEIMPIKTQYSDSWTPLIAPPLIISRPAGQHTDLQASGFPRFRYGDFNRRCPQ